jgi:hypothetical protein
MTDIAHRLRTEKPYCKLSKAAAERIEELERALRFYAEGDWNDGYPGGVRVGPGELDTGHEARKALARPIPVLGTIGEDGGGEGVSDGRCCAVVYRKDQLRRTGRGPTGFEMHYNRGRCKRTAMKGDLCNQHARQEAEGIQVLRAR